MRQKCEPYELTSAAKDVAYTVPEKERPMPTLDPHANRVAAFLEDRHDLSAGVAPFVKQSWRRCHDEYRLDPCNLPKLPILSHRQLLDARDELGENLLIAKEELDGLFAILRGSGYSTSLTDKNGVILLDTADYHSETFCEYDRLGTVWTEEHGGTNGVGTCLHSREFINVFQNEHFFADLGPMACVAAPLFDAKCEFWGVMGISIKQTELMAETHHLAGVVTKLYAERLSNRLFKLAFHGSSIFQFKTPDELTGLVALGDDQVVLGANSAARQMLGIDAAAFGTARLWRYLIRDTQPFRASGAGQSQPVQFKLKQDGKPISGYIQHVAKVINLGEAPARSRPAAAVASVPEGIGLDDWAGSDATLRQQVTTIRRVIKAELPILILGETGVGKDTLARAIHMESRRASGPFVAFNCAAVPESLIDSELFGYASGAFTGASRQGNAGRVVEADGGTLFLDEIGDMPLPLQTRLLRLLETREVMPLGSGRPRKVDIQIIAATNQHLEEAVRIKHFRQDLYYRLAGMIVDVPPLRRRADLDLLIDRILLRISDRPLKLESAARDRLLHHDWPGNIRELGHVLGRAAAIADGDTITEQDLMMRLIDRPAQIAKPIAVPFIVDRPRRLSEEDRERMIEALLQADGDVLVAARKLGISRATLYRKIAQFDIDLKSLTGTVN